ncbi:TPA: hypothetical protein ACS5XU_004080, partial [Salmonella enterica]
KKTLPDAASERCSSVSCYCTLLITVYVTRSERISMPVQMIFRFLVPAVRSSLRCGTPQPELRRAVPAHSKGAGIA